MFEFLRKGASSIFAKIFLAIIVIVFVFWGIGSFTDYQKEIVAEVNRDKITLSQYQEYYNFKYSQLKQTLGDISQEDLQKMKFKDNVLEELIELKLLEQMAKKYSIKVTEEELRLAITHIPVFQEKGNFSKEKYQNFLRSLNLTPKTFEKLIRSELLRQKLFNLLSAPIIVSKFEVINFYNFQNQKLEFLEFSLPISICAKEVKWTEEELESFFHAHRDRYVEDEKVRLAYLFLPYKGDVEITEDELKRYYQENLGRFKEPHRVKLRRILVPGKGEQALTQAKEIRNALKEIKDFDKYVKQRGEWLELDALPEDMRNLLRGAKPGDIFGPIEGREGYLILGVEEIKPERYLKFEEVRPRIISELKDRKIRERVRAEANNLYAKIIAEDGLIKWANKQQVKLEETPYLTFEEIAKFFMSRDIAQNILKRQQGETVSPLETEKGFYIVQIMEKRPKRNLSYNEAKKQVIEDFIAERARTICEKRAQEFINKAKKETNIKKLGEEMGFIVKMHRASRRDLPEVISGRGAPGLIENFHWIRNDLKIFAILSIEETEEKPGDNELNLYRNMLLELKRQRFLNDLLQKERSKAKVKIYPLFQQL